MIEKYSRGLIAEGLMRRTLRVVSIAAALGLAACAAPSAGAQSFAPDRADEAAARKEGVVSCSRK
jgi:hypothetical protein